VEQAAHAARARAHHDPAVHAAGTKRVLLLARRGHAARGATAAIGDPRHVAALAPRDGFVVAGVLGVLLGRGCGRLGRASQHLLVKG